jgi:hypothetical protein
LSSRSRGIGDLALAIALVSRWLVRLWHVPNRWGESKHNLLKNAKGRLYWFFSVPRFNLFKAQVVCEAVHLSPWEIFVTKVSSVLFEPQICPGPIATNVWLVEGGQIKTFALSNVIKINKELQSSMTHSPARLPQAFVMHRFLYSLNF